MCFYRVQYYRVLFSLYKTSVLGFWGGWHLHSLQWGKLIWDNCFKLETGIKLISRHHSTSKFSPFTPGLLPSTQRIKIPTPSRERGGGTKKKTLKKNKGMTCAYVIPRCPLNVFTWVTKRQVHTQDMEFGKCQDFTILSLRDVLSSKLGDEYATHLPSPSFLSVRIRWPGGFCPTAVPTLRFKTNWILLFLLNPHRSCQTQNLSN